MMYGRKFSFTATHSENASMTFRRKPFRRMRPSVESDITSNATIRRIFVERQLVEWTSVEISSKFVEIWSKKEIMRN